jgi:hypothetical protein
MDDFIDERKNEAKHIRMSILFCAGSGKPMKHAGMIRSLMRAIYLLRNIDK